MEKWREIDTYRCLSILPASLYFRNSLLNTLCLLIHKTFVGILASAVPFLLPVPVWRPFRFAARRSRVRAREWTVVGLIIMRPSLMSFLTCVREFAFPISACSAGSSQILRSPTLATLAARRFCDRRFTIDIIYTTCSNQCYPKLTHSTSGICMTNIQSKRSDSVNRGWKNDNGYNKIVKCVSCAFLRTPLKLALVLRMSSVVTPGRYQRPWEQYYVTQPHRTLFRENYAVLTDMPWCRNCRRKAAHRKK